jgi:hypothetical protein
MEERYREKGAAIGMALGYLQHTWNYNKEEETDGMLHTV